MAAPVISLIDRILVLLQTYRTTPCIDDPQPPMNPLAFLMQTTSCIFLICGLTFVLEDIEIHGQLLIRNRTHCDLVDFRRRSTWNHLPRDYRTRPRLVSGRKSNPKATDGKTARTVAFLLLGIPWICW